jgi:hypothetical protein
MLIQTNPVIRLCTYSFALNFVVQWLVLLIYVRDIPGSDIGQEVGCHDVYRGIYMFRMISRINSDYFRKQR